MTPTFYFINSMRTISSITEEKNWQKSMATFLANEVNTTEGDITGPTEQSPNYVFLKEKIMQGSIVARFLRH